MNEIQREINSAFTILSSAMVSGDLVDVIAAAKMSLRRAWQLAADQQGQETPAEDSQDAPGETEGGHE